MRLCILTEGFSQTGYGHLSRCAAIAAGFRQAGFDVSFIVNGDGNVPALLHGFRVEIMDWIKLISELPGKLEGFEFILVDSYLCGYGHYELCASLAMTCIYMDDFNRMPYPPGIIVNGTVGGERLYAPSSKNLLLAGKEYVILREDFRHLPADREINGEIKSVLVTFGGTDPLDITPRVLRLLTRHFPHWEKRVILGAAFKNLEATRMLGDERTKFYFNAPAGEMRDLMLSSDIAISAAGQTTNELAATGTPSALVKVAGNQAYNIEGFMQAGFIDSYVDATGIWNDAGLLAILDSLSSPERRRVLSCKGKAAIDGSGVERLVHKARAYFATSNMQIRRCTESDAGDLFLLANDPLVRRNSFSTEPIAWETHVAWLKSTLSNPHRVLYLITVADWHLIAQVCFDGNENWTEAIVSISIATDFRGLNLASLVLSRAIGTLRKEKSLCHIFNAYIKEENTASRKSFTKAGFTPAESDREDALKYILSYE